VEEFGEVGVGHFGLRQVVADFGRGALGPSAVKSVQFGDGAFRPNAESADVTAGRQVQKIQLFHVQHGDAGNIAEGFSDSVVAVVNDARSQFHDAAPVPHLSLSGAHSLALAHLLHVRPGFQRSKNADGLFGLGDGFDAVVDDQRNFGNLLDFVTFGHDQRRNAGGGDGRRHGESLLVGVDAVMPAAPRLRRREHSAAAAHVAEGTLAGPVSAAAADARNTGHGATGAPRLGRRLLTGQFVHGSRLTRVFHHFVMDKTDDVRPNRSLENGRQMDTFSRHNLIFERVDGDQRTGCHFYLAV